MSEFATILDALYRNFLLRDIFSKVVPGTIVLAAIHINGSVLNGVVDYKAGGLGWPIIVIIAGVAWVIGFAVQEIGNIFRLAHHHPPSCNDREERYNLRIDFWQNATPIEAQQSERYAIIKEASANGGIAVIIVAIVFSCKLIITGTTNLLLSPTLPSLLLLSMLLLRTNHEHANKQYSFMKLVITKHQSVKDGSDLSGHPDHVINS